MTRATLLVAGVLVAATLILAACGQQAPSEKAQAGEDTPGVVRIGQQVVTLDDFREGVRIVETNLEYMKGEISKGSFDSSFLQEFVQLIERTGIQTVALGSLIQDRALYERAVANGFSATDQEVTTRLERDRELFRDPPIGAETTAYQATAYIKAAGEDRYWSELYPAKLRREMAIHNMWTATMADFADQGSRESAWAGVERRAIHSVSIDVLNADAIAPATVPNALAYLEKHRQLPQ